MSGHRAAWLVAILGLSFAVAADEPPASSLELPRPNLEAADPEVREELERAHRRVEELGAAGTGDRELAAAVGELGQLYLAYGFLDPAAAALEAARARAPSEPAWVYLLGYTRQLQGKREAAIAALEDAVALAPHFSPFLNRLALLYLDEGRLDGARRLFETAVEHDPACAGALYGLGEIARRRGEPKRALRLFRSALEIEPGAAPLRYALAQTLGSLGRIEEAAREMEGVELRGVGEWQGCRDPIVASLNETATGAAARLVQGGQASLRGAGETELAAYRQAVAADPDAAEARKLLGGTLLRRGEIAEAAEELGRAVELAPGDAAAREALAEALMRLGRLDEAGEALEAVLAADPERKTARLRLTRIHLEGGRNAEALAQAEHVLAADRWNREARLQRALALMRLGRGKAAVAELSGMLEDDPPAEPADRLLLVSLLVSLGEVDGAEERVEALLRLEAPDPVRARAMLLLGRLRERRGALEAARESYLAALALDPGLAEARTGVERLKDDGG